MRLAEHMASGLESSDKATAGKWMNTADQMLTERLATARLAVMLARGVRWSEPWLEAGFTHRGTNVPKAIVPRLELARRVVGFFARHPEFGIAHAKLTASHGRKAFDDRVWARQLRRHLVAQCNNAKSVATLLSGSCDARCDECYSFSARAS